MSKPLTRILFVISDKEKILTDVAKEVNHPYSLVFTQAKKLIEKKLLIKHPVLTDKRGKMLYTVNYGGVAGELIEFIKTENPVLSVKIKKRYYSNSLLRDYLKELLLTYKKEPLVDFSLYDVFKTLSNQNFTTMYKGTLDNQDSQDFTDILSLLEQVRATALYSDLNRKSQNILSELK